MVNGGAEACAFVIQEDTHPWRLVVDTGRPSPADIDLVRPQMLSRPSYVVEPGALVVLVRRG
jgi:hypothetical protein